MGVEIARPQRQERIGDSPCLRRVSIKTCSLQKTAPARTEFTLTKSLATYGNLPHSRASNHKAVTYSAEGPWEAAQEETLHKATTEKRRKEPRRGDACENSSPRGHDSKTEQIPKTSHLRRSSKKKRETGCAGRTAPSIPKEQTPGFTPRITAWLGFMDSDSNPRQQFEALSTNLGPTQPPTNHRTNRTATLRDRRTNLQSNSYRLRVP